MRVVQRSCSRKPSLHYAFGCPYGVFHRSETALASCAWTTPGLFGSHYSIAAHAFPNPLRPANNPRFACDMFLCSCVIWISDEGFRKGAQWTDNLLNGRETGRAKSMLQFRQGRAQLKNRLQGTGHQQHPGRYLQSPQTHDALDEAPKVAHKHHGGRIQLRGTFALAGGQVWSVQAHATMMQAEPCRTAPLRCDRGCDRNMHQSGQMAAARAECDSHIAMLTWADGALL